MVVIGKGTLAIFEGAEDRIGAFKPTVSGRFGPIGVFPGEKSPCTTQAVEKQNRCGDWPRPLRIQIQAHTTW